MLHVTNGDAAAEAIRSTGVDGELLVWRDVLHEGPVPRAASEEELRAIRAEFLSRSGWVTRGEALADLERRDARLESALARGEEIVLWFEPDLFDQLQLLQITARLAHARRPARALAVETDGPIALAPTAELVAAFARARPWARAQLDLGALAWAAFRSPDPRLVEDVVAVGTAALPALGDALLRHLEQFPGVVDGLSRSERQLVAALAGGPLEFGALFDRAQEAERQRFLGDVVCRFYLDRLAAPPAPLVVRAGETWQLTDFGRRVHEGVADRLASARLDRWLGGVRLMTPKRVWRWDAGEQRLVPPPGTPPA